MKLHENFPIFSVHFKIDESQPNLYGDIEIEELREDSTTFNLYGGSMVVLSTKELAKNFLEQKNVEKSQLSPLSF